MSNKLSLWDLCNKQDEFISLLNTHNHDASNLTGFSNVAISGSFSDLKDVPSIVNTVNGKKGAVTITSDDINALSKNASCNKNWNYIVKPGQPSYVWGGNDNVDMYIYNPSNFSVSNSTNSAYATSAGTASNASNANKLGGYSLDQIKELIKNDVKILPEQFIRYSDTVRQTLTINNTLYSIQSGSNSMVNTIKYMIGTFFIPYTGSIKIKFNNCKFDISGYPNSIGTSNRANIGAGQLLSSYQSPTLQVGKRTYTERDNTPFGTIIGDLLLNDPYRLMFESNINSTITAIDFEYSTQNNPILVTSNKVVENAIINVDSGGYLTLYCSLVASPPYTGCTNTTALSLGTIDICYDLI